MGDILMYYYFLDKHRKEVTEMQDISEKDKVIFGSLGIPYFDHFPYAEAGFEDPYEFLENYTLIKLVDNVFEVVENV